MVNIRTNQGIIVKARESWNSDGGYDVMFQSIKDNECSNYVVTLSKAAYELIIAERKLVTSFKDNCPYEERLMLFGDYQSALEKKLEEDEKMRRD